MSTRYGDRGFGRYGDSDEDRAEERGYGERDASREYGRGGEYGSQRRGGYASPRGGADFDYSRDYGYGRDYGTRPGSRDYGGGEYPPRYGRERQAGGGYAGPSPRRYEGEDYGRDYGSRAYGRDAVRDYERGRARAVPEDEGVRDYDTDYGRTTSRFYGRSGYEYGREDYDRDDDRDERRGYGGRAYAERRDERGGGSWLDRAADQVRSWFGGDDEPEHRGRREGMRASGGGEGKFRGRGPKNYRRSDDRLREEVCDRLTDNEWLDASDVEVNVVASEVILTGVVDSRYAKRLAENIAESVSGVANVQNNLRVHSYQAAEQAAAPLTAPPPAAPPALTSDVTATSDLDARAPSDTTETGLSSRAAGRS